MHGPLQDHASSRLSCAVVPGRPPRPPAEDPEQPNPAASTQRRGGGVMLVALPADIRARCVSAGGLVSAAWAPGVALIIADLALVDRWDARALGGLLEAHRELASRGTEVRLVVWSRDLYQAVRASSVGTRPEVYASLNAALSAVRTSP